VIAQGSGVRERPGNISGLFLDVARDLTKRDLRAALWFERVSDAALDESGDTGKACGIIGAMCADGSSGYDPVHWELV
jgi:hypothetical protein